MVESRLTDAHVTTAKDAEDKDTEHASAAWISVVRAYNECTATLAASLAPLEVSLLEHEILINLLRTPGLTQRQLSERCYSAKSGISMMVARMHKRGLVERRSLPGDQRAWSIVLTPEGADLAAKVHAVQARIIADMTEPYTGAELSLVKDLMDATSERLRKLRETTG